MQTFLPYSCFFKTAECLDYRRLGKQRVEAYQILKVLNNETISWQNHPAVKMWTGYQSCLALYGVIICREWIKRGYNDNLLNKIIPYYNRNIVYPKWLGNEQFHKSHQSNLLRKNPEYYSKFFAVPDDLPYIWNEVIS